MAFIEVYGGSKLFGECKIQGSKNAVLPMLAACILCDETVRINNCPKIQDVYAMLWLLKSIGCNVAWEGHDVIVEAKEIVSDMVEEQCVRTMRSSIILLGSMLGRKGSITISYPGGCLIGARPFDIHLHALRQMNVEVVEKDQMIRCKTEELTGALTEFYYPSVGATENIILAAVTAKGETTIHNAAKEPEIIELCRFLRSMGAQITGEGTGQITILGVKKLHGTTFTVVSDRIVAGTFITAAAGCGGEVFLHMDCADQLEAVISVIRDMEADISVQENGVLIRSGGHLKQVDLIKTDPYPGFPTDMQSQVMAVLSVAGGTSIIIENIFEGRYKTADELKKMGADITVEGRAAVINGVTRLTGTNVKACDLRGGAALIIAGLLAKGATYVHQIGFVERGYEDICGNLKMLGAKIKLVNDEGHVWKCEG